MRPLIPRVRVGDILKGTRNLRNYLQTASTLNYVTSLIEKSRKKAKESIFYPTKEERFLVTVNSWGMFGICSLDSNVVLLFSNPAGPAKSSTQNKNHSPSLIAFGNKRMDPTIFSKWFIRTTEKRTDLREWSDYAYHMRVTLHLNLCSIGRDHGPTFHAQPGASGPFCMSQQDYGMKTRQKSTLLLQHWIVRGITRPSSHKSRAQLRSVPTGFGPLLEETAQMRQEIESLCSNPRIAQKLKAEMVGHTHIMQVPKHLTKSS